MVAKTLDAKLTRLKAEPRCGDFIIADAKDADMAYGIAAPGKSPEMHAHEGRYRSLAEYRDGIRAVVGQGEVDIVLMSAHTNALLTIDGGLFENSTVTPAARANDTTDIHLVRGGTYAAQPGWPFQSTTIDHIQCGHIDCDAGERRRGANLGLYSVTFNNDRDLDRQTLERYKEFRLEAERKGFRHFLEVFDPNAARTPVEPGRLGGFVNDMIVRSLAGVPEASRPVFLKMVYHGPQFTEELAHYDPTLIIGVLGGSAGTTYDAFKLIADAQKYGARAALFGRKINNAEHQLAFISLLRRIVEGVVSAEEAVRAYHGVLAKLGLKPLRSLADDLQLTEPAVAYSGRKWVAVAGTRPRKGGTGQPAGAASGRRGMGNAAVAAGQAGGDGVARGGHPDIAAMSSAERLAYFRERINGNGKA